MRTIIIWYSFFLCYSFIKEWVIKIASLLCYWAERGLNHHHFNQKSALIKGEFKSMVHETSGLMGEMGISFNSSINPFRFTDEFSSEVSAGYLSVWGRNLVGYLQLQHLFRNQSRMTHHRSNPTTPPRK